MKLPCKITKLLALGMPWFAWANSANGPTPQYMTTVQIAVRESTPALKLRSQKLVLEEFDHAIKNWPELTGRPYELKRQGDQIIVTLLSDRDLKDPMQGAVYQWLDLINGKAEVLGRTHFYRQASTQPIKGYLKVIVSHGGDQGDWIKPELEDELPKHHPIAHSEKKPEIKEPPKIVSISAGSVPLRNLLNVIERKVGDISYLIHEECLNRRVTWNFGETGSEPPREIETVMAQLATFLGLKHEPSHGTHVFQGTCAPILEEREPAQGNRHQASPQEPWLTEVSLADGGPNVRRIQPKLVIPLMPLTY